MASIRIALGNVRFPSSPSESLDLALEAMDSAAENSARLICFPECLVPGYRIGETPSELAPDWLEQAWSAIDTRAAEFKLGVILGTERTLDENLPRITARVTRPDGSLAGFQDKVQLDPSEEGTYAPGVGRRVFQVGDLIFGVVICHEGWRYPETVRWAARQGAHVVFHPHVELIEDESFQPKGFADPSNSFHEKAALCRAAENTCYFATVNCALPGASTTSALIDPEGRLIAHQPHGQEGILFGEIDPAKATGLLARRYRPEGME